MKDWLKDNERYIKMFFPIFSLNFYYILLAASVFIICYHYSKFGFIGIITFGTVGFAIEVFVFDSWAGYCKNKIKKMFLEFISILSGYSLISENMIKALKETIEFLKEPLKSILSKNIYLYEKGQITQYELFTKLSDEIGDDEFKKLFLILSTTEDEGSNYTEVLNEMRKRADEDYGITTQVESTSTGGVVVIFIMLALNLYSFNVAVGNPETSAFLVGTNYGNVLMIENLIFIIIALLIARWMIH